jgi:hypothetical protein
LAALFADFEFRSEQCLGGGSAETNDDFRLNQTNLGFEPWTAGGNFSGVWFFMNATFTTWFPFKMLDYVGDVSLGTINAGLDQSFIQ